MSGPFIGEIRMFGGSFAPVGWAFCDGQLLPISENETLFNLIGTTYGGDGQETFALPNLQGRAPVHAGTSTTGTTYQLAEAAGVEEVVLTINQIPNHSHPIVAQAATGNAPTPASAFPAAANQDLLYASPGGAEVGMAPGALAPVGGSQPHTNMQPYTVISFIVSLFGVFPHQ